MISIREMIGYGGIISVIFSFVAGILTSITPCNLSSLPLVILQFSENKSKKDNIIVASIFSFGMAITFGIMGTLAVTVGRLNTLHNSLWYVILGILMILISFQTFGFIQLINPTYMMDKNKLTGRVGAFSTGVLAGLFSSPCSTPILASIIILILASKNMAYSFMLLTLYSLGNCITTIVIALVIDRINKLKKQDKYYTLSKVLNNILGILILLLGFYLIYLGI